MNSSPLIQEILARRPWLAEFDTSNVAFSSTSPSHFDVDIHIAERLISAYQCSQAACPEDYKPNDVWTNFVDQHYGEMLELVAREDASGLAAYLLRLPREGGGHGYFQGQQAYQNLKNSSDKQIERAFWLLDHLVGCAESLGLLRVRCPEQGEWQAAAMSSITELCQRIEQAFAMPICFPEIFDGFFALETESGPCHLRSMMAAYALDLVHKTLATVEGLACEQLQIAELGAGIGFTGYAAAKLGVRRYSIFDLPEINLAQGFFLMMALGEDAVRLFGEAPGPRVEVMPAWQFEPMIGEGFDAVLNVDSFPEIDRKFTDHYLRAMPSGSKYFFSLNQEAPRGDAFTQQRDSVRQMVAETSNYQCLFRMKNWIRSGYVDEVFRLTS